MAALRRWTIGLSILASAAAGGRALLAGPPPRPEKARAAVDAAPPRAAVEIPVELARIDIAAEGAEVEIRPDVASIASRWMRIDHSIEDGRFRTSRIDNRAASTSLAVEGEDFVIEIGGRPPVASSALRLVEKPRRESAPGERVRLVADLAGEGLRVRMITELRGGGGWAERWLEIRGEPGTLDRVALARWPCPDARGPAGPGALVGALGLPSGRGQVVYARDLFFAVAHPGAESYARDGRIDCSIADYRPIDAERPLITRPLVIGAGAAGDAWRCFIRYIDETRAVPSRMIFLVNDWYWKDKSRPLEAIRALARVKRESGVPVDSFTLDDG
ncbi:MAG: hypothetical protein JXA90_12035, partial [Planctomycetes bacterium]|nr:hypothetical protein [Planctomycetota bacterium]